jgi:hypothetical protein
MIKENKKIGKINDVHMMVVCPRGKERTKDEFKYLLGKSGFKLSNIINENEALVIIEAILK